MSQEHIARDLGVHAITVSKWERGVQRPSAGYLDAMAELYGVTARELLRGEKLIENAYSGEPGAGGGQADDALGEPRTDYSAATPARHARNLPLAVREYLAELRLRLTKGGATEDEIDEAMELLRSPALFTFYKGGAPSEFNEADVLRGMKALAEGVVIPELRDRGRKIR